MKNEKLKVDIPGVDANSGLSLCDDDMDIYLSSLRLYVTNIPGTLEKMRSVSSDSLHNYSISVHGVKGMSEYIGAEETRKTAKQLEMLSKEGNLTAVLDQNETFIKNTENMVNNIRSWLKKNDPSFS